MAEFPTFKEQQLFTGVKFAQGFKPEKAPDYTTGLREEAESSLKNLSALEQKLNAEDAIRVNRDLQNLEALRQFSPTIGRIAELQASAWIDSQYIAAQDDIRKLGKINNYGITEEEIASTQFEVEQWREASQASGEASAQLAKAGGTAEQVNYIKGIAAGSWRRFHIENFYTGEQAKTAPDRWQQYKLKNANRTYKDRLGQQFTLNEVGTDQHRAGVVFAHFARTDLTNFGISQNFNPDKITMKPYYEAIENLGTSYIKSIRDAHTVETSENLRRQYQASFLERDTEGKLNLSAFHANYRGLTITNKEGKLVTLDNRQALLVALDDISELYKSNAISYDEGIALLSETAAHAPKGQSYGAYHREAMNNFKDNLDKIRTAKFSFLQLQEREANFSVQKVSEQFVADCERTGTCTVADYNQLKSRLIQLRPGANYSVIDNAIVRTSQRQNDEFYVKQFDEDAKNFGLTVSEVNQASMSPEQKEKYMQIARQQDAIRATFTLKSEDVNSALDQALRDSLGKTNLDESASGLRLARIAAKNQMNKIIKNQYDQTGTADQQNALNAVLDQIGAKRGDFAISGLDPAATTHKAFFPAFVAASAGGTLKPGKEYQPYTPPVYQIENFRDDPADYLKENDILDSASQNNLIRDITAGVPNPRVPQVLRMLHAQDPLGRELHQIVNEALEGAGRSERMKPHMIDLMRKQTTGQKIDKLLRDAITPDEIRRRAAAAGGGSTNVERYGNPTVQARLQNRVDADGLERSWTGALTYSGNKDVYKSSLTLLQDTFSMKITEHADFGGLSPVHSAKGYHPFNEAADIYVNTNNGRAADLRETAKIKTALRKLNLFKEIIGPGDGDPNHEGHLHVGGLMRPLTKKDMQAIRQIIGGLQ
jgi:hypothetical protein